MLAAAGLAAGLERAYALRRRAVLIAALASALELLRGRLARSGPEAARGFFTLFSAGLSALGEKEVSEIWDSAARTLPLSEAEREALAAAGRSLGRYGAEEQEAAISRSVAALSRFAEEARARAESGQRGGARPRADRGDHALLRIGERTCR